MSEDTGVQVKDRPWEQLRALAERGDSAALSDYLDSLSAAEQALAVSRLEQEAQSRVLEVLPPEEAAQMLRGFSETQAAVTVEGLDAQVAAAIVHELHSDEQADVLGDLTNSQAEAILRALPAEEAEAMRQLSAYADDVAGGLMHSEFLKFEQSMTVAEVIEQLSSVGEDYDDSDVWYGYVCDQDGRLVGVLPMRNLLFVKRSARISDLMIANPLSVFETTKLDELIDVFDDHSFLGVPVVDDAGVLKGIVHREAVDHEATRAAESDFLKSQGIVGGEELRTMPLLLRSRRRLSWLSINIFLNILAATVIAAFQDTLEAVIALAVFLPIISDMSGCSGNQAVAVSMRELSLGLIRPQEVLRVWWQEASVGLINGFVLGLLIAVLAYAFKGNVYLGLVVGSALFVNTLIAVSIGGTVPLLLKRLGFDPAVASGPLLTTVTDMCGFFCVLGLATLLLDQLAGI